MLAPDLWRKTLKPRMAKIIKTAKDIKPDLLVFLPRRRKSGADHSGSH